MRGRLVIGIRIRAHPGGFLDISEKEDVHEYRIKRGIQYLITGSIADIYFLLIFILLPNKRKLYIYAHSNDGFGSTFWWHPADCIRSVSLILQHI